MKRLLVILIAAGLILAACGAEGSRGGGSFDDTTPVAVVPTPLSGASSTPLPTDTPPPSPVAVPSCAPEVLNLGDPALWVEGATVTVIVKISDPAGLPTTLTSDNGLSMAISEAEVNVTYGPLSLVPSSIRVLTLTLANGAVCSATVTILAAAAAPLDTPTSVPTDTPVPSPTPLSTDTPTPIPTLVPIGATATSTPTITVTLSSLPVTGGGEEENQPPESPLDQIWELIQIFFGGG